MRKGPEDTTKDVKKFSDMIYVGKRKEIRSFCDGKMNRQMNETTVCSAVIICWKGKGMLRCSSQHNRNLISAQKEDLGWILGKKHSSRKVKDWAQANLGSYKNSCCIDFKKILAKYALGAGKDKISPASMQTIMDLGDF